MKRTDLARLAWVTEHGIATLREEIDAAMDDERRDCRPGCKNLVVILELLKCLPQEMRTMSESLSQQLAEVQAAELAADQKTHDGLAMVATNQEAMQLQIASLSAALAAAGAAGDPVTQEMVDNAKAALALAESNVAAVAALTPVMPTPVEPTPTPVEPTPTPVEDAPTPVEPTPTPVEDAPTPVPDEPPVDQAPPADEQPVDPNAPTPVA